MEKPATNYRYWIIYNAIFALSCLGYCYGHSLLLAIVFVCIFWKDTYEWTSNAIRSLNPSFKFERPRFVPAWLDISFDVALTTFLFLSGHRILAAFWAWETVCTLLVFGNLPFRRTVRNSPIEQ